MTKLSSILRFILEKKEGLVLTDELISLGFYRVSVSRVLGKLVKEGILFKIRRGVYSKHKLESLDVFLLASTLFGGYLGFATACYLYKWLEYYPFEVHVVTKDRSGQFRVGDSMIEVVALKEKAVGSGRFKDYVVSTKAKTVFDIFYKPELIGGYRELVKVLYNADLLKKDWLEFKRFVEMFGTKSYRQRVGFILSELREVTGKKMPALNWLKPREMVVTNLGDGMGAYSKEWGIINCLGDELFGWYNECR